MSEIETNLEERTPVDGLAPEILDDKQEETQDDKPEVIEESRAAVRARKTGWRPIEEFNGDKEEWRTAEEFNARGEFIGKLKSQQDQIDLMQEEFGNRITNMNKVHAADLKIKLDESIEDADKEKAHQYQQQIDDLNTPIARPTDNTVSELDNWNQSNPWIMGDDPKAAYGKQQFSSYQSQGLGTQQAIRAMEQDVARLFPAQQAVTQHPTSERGSKPGRRAAAKSLSMADLTHNEQKYYNAMPDAWASDKEFLQAVQDSRGE